MRLGLGAALTVVALSAAVGCSAAPGDENVASDRARIIDGTASGADQDAVVMILIRNKGACSGTLVAPNLVLTARHCVTEVDEAALCKADGTAYQGGGVYSNFAPTDLLVYLGQQASQRIDDPTKSDAVAKQIIVDDTSTYCNADVAFILLNHAVSAPVAPLRLRSGARQGEMITAVGWGLTEDGKIPLNRMARSGIAIQAVGPYVFDESTKVGLGNSEFLIGEGICSGDSGGPAFASTGAIVGVVSRGGNGQDGSGASTCIGTDTVGIYTDLVNKTTLVEKAFNLAGYTPRDEGSPPGKAAGQACTDDVECSSNTCVAKICRTPCTDDTSCGEGETCTTTSGVKVCMPKQQTSSEDPAATPGDDSPDQPRKITKTTTSGCSAAPAGGASSPASILAAVGLALALGRRRRRMSDLS